MLPAAILLFVLFLQLIIIVVVNPSVCVDSEGEEWQNVRRLLGKHMLRPKAVEAYDRTLNSVVTDLIEKLKLRKQQDSSGVVTDISAEFYRFGLEGKSLRLMLISHSFSYGILHEIVENTNH